ncbi:MAG: hypothetical protein HY800_00325 [Ignavibacteriales bacterium]|nr:hypothetical protein [Ignavibacteriales bacterium]
MSRSYILLFCILASLISTSVFAQDVIKGKNDFKVDLDIARFYGDSTESFIELYYGFSEGSLTYQEDSGQYKGEIFFKLEIRDSTRMVANKEWIVPHIITQPEKLSAPQTLVGLQSLGLPFGEYIITLIAYDSFDQSRRDSITYPLSVIIYPTDKEFLSDIEFCTSIQSSSNTQSLFYKNTLEVVPNPSRLYGTGLPIMYYYTTAYNLLLQNNQSSIIIRTSVIDAAGREIITKDKTKPRL